MRLLFLILAHDRPEQAAELARTLVAAARDGHARIHFDARSAPADFERLRAAVADVPRIALVEKRVACPWGSFGLVEAPLNAFAQIEAENLAPDYVILLSGACLPCRPIATLERYLAATAGREFIEVADDSWVGNGWRSERWKYRFWFDHKTQHPAEWAFFQLQRLLRLERRFPEGLTPRFGSQWWALTGDTCRAILMDIRRAPERLAFFRSVWIPDEMVIQTYVHALVHPDEIAGFGLTHFQFSNRGKPAVFHDDHLDYVSTLERFFLRKVAPGALRLRAALLARAGDADASGAAAPDGEDAAARHQAAFAGVGARRSDYLLKVAAQTHYPRPGQIFYRDQRDDMSDSVLGRVEGPYVVLLGPPALTRPLAAALAQQGEPGGDPVGDPVGDGGLTVLGEVFAPGEVDLGPGRETLGGLTRRDASIRDMHPALYLARLRARCPGVPVLRWSPLHRGRLLETVLRDPRALVVACLPFSGREERDRQLLAWACLADDAGALARAAAPLPGIAPAPAWRARVDLLGGSADTWLDWLGQALFYPAPTRADRMLVQGAQLALPWDLDPAGPLPGTPAAGAAARRALLERSVAGCRFAAFPWFGAVAQGARAFWERALRDGADPAFAPLSSEAEGLLRLVGVRAASAPAAAPDAHPAEPGPPESGTTRIRTPGIRTARIRTPGIRTARIRPV